MMIARILICLDASSSSAVLAMGLEMVRRFGAEAWLLRVVTIPHDEPSSPVVATTTTTTTTTTTQPPSPTLPADRGDALLPYIHALEHEALQRHLQANPGLSIHPPIVELSSQPWRKILGVAEERNVDLIVLGSQAYHDIDRLLATTSIASTIATIAERNVLVVPAREREQQ